MTTATTTGNNRIKEAVTKTKVATKKAAATKQPNEIVIPAIKLATLRLRLQGTTTLIMHAWSEKAKAQMLAKQMKENLEREPKCPQEDFINSMIWIQGEKPEPEIDEETKIKTYDIKAVKTSLSKAVFGIPAVCIKSAIVSAARYVDGLAMTVLRGAIFVKGDEKKKVSWDTNEFIRINSPHLPNMREDMVRIDGGRTADIRFRGEYIDWYLDIEIITNANFMSVKQIANLVMIAGFHGGLGELRPEKCGQNHGRFDIIQM